MVDREYSHYDSFTIPGHWWLPGHTAKIAGELHYHDAELTLRLFGAFHKAEGDIPFDYSPEEHSVDVIHGESFSFQRVTAFRAFYTSWRSGERGLRPAKSAKMKYSTLHVHAVLIGEHVQSLQEQRYTKCRIQFRNLEAWLGDVPFKDSQYRKNGWRIQYIRPKDRQHKLPAPFTRLQIKSSWSGSGVPPVNRREIVHRANVLLEPSEPQPLSWYGNVVGGLGQLFSLLAGKRMESEKEWLYATDDARGSLLYHNCHKVNREEDYGPIDFLFRYPDVKDYFSNILSVWLTAHGTVRHALNLFFSSLREPGVFLETRFLPIIQALEVYARADEQQTYIDPQMYTGLLPHIKSAIPTDIDKELRLAIVGRLEYANEYSLRTRLRRLIGTMDSKTVKLFCSNASTFVGGVVDTRNYLTHYSDVPCHVLGGMDLHWATVKLRTMFSILLLKWIGLPETLIYKRARADYSLGTERREWASASETGTLNK
jgi:hypothetical protein